LSFIVTTKKIRFSTLMRQMVHSKSLTVNGEATTNGLCCHGIGGGGLEASKSLHDPTIACGLTAAGEALPPHFWLKTDATKENCVKISVDFVAQCHNVTGKFGHKEVKMHRAHLDQRREPG